MASLSQRHLLSLAEAETEALDGLGIGAIVTASVLTLVLVLVLLMCTCDQGRWDTVEYIMMKCFVIKMSDVCVSDGEVNLMSLLPRKAL